MNYQSTRSSETADSVRAVLNGLSSDGGLYVNPDISNTYKQFDWKGTLKLSTIDMAKSILKTLLPDFKNMDTLVERAYEGKFETEDLTPLVQVGEDYILELFRGPTSAFKDVALSMLPQLITGAREQTNLKDKIIILTATSGDTGKAALEGFHDVEGTGIIVFYPYGGVSQIQKAQMVTQEGKNVKVCAVKGNFDDCQRGVKKAFTDLTGKLKSQGIVLSSANSINIGRLAPQVVYYFAAYRDLIDSGRITEGDKVSFVVPTGNFGDILAGFYAHLMGLPVERLVCAANINNVLTDFINTGVYDKNRPFYKTDSPSMDILVSSNLERLLFTASENNTEKVKEWMRDLSEKGSFSVDKKTLEYIQKLFSTAYCTKEDTLKTIKSYWNNYKYLIDPHTAVACYVAEKYKNNLSSKKVLSDKDSGSQKSAPLVILSTASPYKFPSAILNALEEPLDADEFDQMKHINRITGVKIPKNLESLQGKSELHTDVIEKDELENYIIEYACKN